MGTVNMELAIKPLPYAVGVFMSIIGHFDPAPDAGFVRTYDPRAARRQFQISVALIVILTFAAFTLGFLIQFDAPAGLVGPAPNLRVPHVAVASTMDGNGSFCSQRLG